MPGGRRLENAALVLPIFGALMIVPPLLGVFNTPILVAGVPLVAIYLFSVWIALIAITAVLSRRMRNAPNEPVRRDMTDRTP